MQLFQPNNLSKRTPEFTLLHDPMEVKEVTALLEKHYDLSVGAELKISVFSGMNISSNNLEIETSSTKLFLKSRNLESESKMRAEAEISFALSELGQRVPRIIRSNDGRLVCSEQHKF